MAESGALPRVVLVVEDEAFVRTCVSMHLEGCGFSVIEAADAAEALRAFASDERVSAVFTDINMPGGMGGLLLAREIYALRPQVRVIITSGRGEPAGSEMPSGAQFLPKPYDYGLLERLLAA